MNYVLDAAIRAEDINVIVEVLRKFHEMKREPKPVYLKRLGEADYLPPAILAELMLFKTKFGKVIDERKPRIDP